MLDVLSRIAVRFQEAEVIWALGASFLLYYHGLVEAPHDIDLMVERGSIEKADAILRQLGDKQEPEQNPLYGTDYFYEYVIDGVEVDVMAGLQIKHREGCFVYRFDAKAVDGTWQLGAGAIPLGAPEDWYVLYQLMPGREAKADSLDHYLQRRGVKRRDLLERCLTGELPAELREKIEIILSRYTDTILT
ncbi:MAG: hypothetical protein EOM03_13185 [Clostridia bacterium]|nr:hypothetical protein [Clostridia bacterium]NLF21248.1 hypothetical protein [Clostridiaceae bacterium]